MDTSETFCRGSPDAFGKGIFARFLHAMVYRFSPIWACLFSMLVFPYLTTPASDETKFAPAVITEYILYSIALVIIMFGIVAAILNQQGWMVVWYSRLCILAYSLITVVFFITILTHVNNKDELINGCVPLARNGEKDDLFGTWANPPPSPTMNEVDAQDYCSKQYEGTKLVSIIIFIDISVLFAYFIHAALARATYAATQHMPHPPV